MRPDFNMKKRDLPWVAAGKLAEEINNMQVDILSARCTADRLRIRVAAEQLATAATEETIVKLEKDLRFVLQFVREVHAVKAALEVREGRNPK